MEVVTLTVTTNSGGSGSVIAARGTGSGYAKFLVRADWHVGDLASGVDVALSYTDVCSNDVSLLTLTDANSDAQYYPRTPEHDDAGAELDTSTLYIIDGDLKLTVTDGGDTKTGSVTLYLLDA